MSSPSIGSNPRRQSIDKTGLVVRPAACFFDFDGLLADTAALWRRAFTEVCGPAIRIDLEALNGRSVPDAAVTLSRQVGVKVEATHLMQSLTRAFRAQPPSLLPGARRLIQELGGSIRLFVVTNGPRHLVEDVLGAQRLRHHFEAIVSSESVADPKPAPDVYLAACRAARVRPADAVAFEDSLVGVQSAFSAGLRVVGVSAAVALPAHLLVARLDDAQVLRFVGL